MNNTVGAGSLSYASPGDDKKRNPPLNSASTAAQLQRITEPVPLPTPATVAELAAASEARMLTMMLSIQSSMGAMAQAMAAMSQQQAAALQQQQQQRQAEAAEQQRTEQPGREQLGEPQRRVQTAADVQSTPVSVRRLPTARSIQASLEGRTPVQRHTPYTASSAVDEEEEDPALRSGQRPDGGEHQLSREQRLQLKDAMAMVRNCHVPVFHADTEADKDMTVMDFVQKVETAITDMMPGLPQLELIVVRAHLSGGALDWMNDRVAKMTLAGQGPVQWTHVRRAFIDAHVGADTLEMWLAKLATLRLGEGKATTPNELDSQFDKVARHCHPGVPIDSPGIDLMLAEKYSTIIANSNEWMWKRILNSQAPRATLNDWKKAVANDFNTQAALAQRKAAAKPASSGGQEGGWKGKGRGKKGGFGSERQPAKAAGMSSEDTFEERTTRLKAGRIRA